MMSLERLACVTPPPLLLLLVTVQVKTRWERLERWLLRLGATCRPALAAWKRRTASSAAGHGRCRCVVPLMWLLYWPGNKLASICFTRLQQA
jgi:hypothetical protein